jgi:uncharacterized protein (DUF305 family)
MSAFRAIACLAALGIAAPVLAAEPVATAQAHSADHAMMSGMTKMNHDMASAPMTGDADHDFAAMMIPHHQGAIDMAQVELQYGKDPELRKLAEGIIAAQKKEIAQMQRWQLVHPAAGK